jgi:hypothetical protein
MITSKSGSTQTRSETLPAQGQTRTSNRKATVIPQAKSPSKDKPGSRPQSKQDRVLAMLRQRDGTTIPAVMKATGWQQHSVHGFLSGVVRKKLKLKLQSAKVGDKRIYRLVDSPASKAGGRRSNRQSAA